MSRSTAEAHGTVLRRAAPHHTRLSPSLRSRHRRALLFSAAAAALTALVVPATAAHAATESTDTDFVRGAYAILAAAAQACSLAQGISADSGIKSIAAKVAAADTTLGKATRTAATGLKVSLAAVPASTQPVSPPQLQTLSGAAFDAGYINAIWAADSSLLADATAVHATTRNAAVRKLTALTTSAMVAQLPVLQASGLIHMSGGGASASAPAASSIRLPGGATIDATVMADARTGKGFLMPGTKASVAVLAVAVLAALAVWMRRRARASSMRGARHQSPPVTRS